MKYPTLLISFLLSIQYLAYAQESVRIVDENFKTCIQTNLPQLLNTNGELILDSAKIYKGNLRCTNKNIEQVPELIYFESITRLELNQNKIQKLPSLHHLKYLTFLYVAENQLTELPPLDSLKALEQLICWKNQLTTLPDISKLHNLHRLDVPVNQLTKFPPLSPIAPMRTLLVDDNLITDLPDLSIYPLLQIVKLVNNQLSFDDLEMILRQPNPAIYDYYPQKIFNVLNPSVADEGTDFALSTGLDINNNNVQVQWLKNNTSFGNTTDTLHLSTLRLSDAGSYRAVLSSNLFPGKPLYTNSSVLTVRACPDVQTISMETTPAKCTTPGSVHFSESDTDYRYQLSSVANKVFDSTAGEFTSLTEGTYTAVVIHPSGCKKTYPETVVIDGIDCEEIVISPDGDGYQDEFYFSHEGKGVLYDKFGNKMLELQLPIKWNGAINGQKIAPGYYRLDINGGASFVGVTVIY